MPAISGRVAAVTGGARGIGLAIGTALAGAGARVVLGDLDGDLAAERAAAIGAVGLPLDVRDDASYRRFLDETGPLDILVNNAGVAGAGRFLDAPPGRQELEIEVNLGGVVRGLRLALPGMVARGRGQVVTIASAAGRIPSPGAAVYSATKHAVVGLNDAVRAELRGTGVHLTALLPTVVTTEMSAGLRLRGLPVVSAETVARRVLRVLRARRPPASVMVPRWLRLVALGDAIAPQGLRDLARSLVSVDDAPAHRPYDERVSRQLPPSRRS